MLQKLHLYLKYTRIVGGWGFALDPAAKFGAERREVKISWINSIFLFCLLVITHFSQVRLFNYLFILLLQMYT